MTFLGKKCHGIFYVYQIIDTPDCLTFWNYLFCWYSKEDDYNDCSCCVACKLYAVVMEDKWQSKNVRQIPKVLFGVDLSAILTPVRVDWRVQAVVY